MITLAKIFTIPVVQQTYGIYRKFYLFIDRNYHEIVKIKNRDVAKYIVEFPKYI